MEYNKLIITPDGWKHYILVEDFQEKTKIGTIRVPKGFRTDLASVPRFFWWIIPPMGRHTQAAVIHDHLCNIGHPWKESAEIFYDLMIKYKTYKWKAKCMYYAVRIYGFVMRYK